MNFHNFVSLALCAAPLLAASCASHVAEEPSQDGVETALDDAPSSLSKAEVAKLEKADHIDYCAAYGWYDDGVCDSFCSSPDPDCAGQACHAACDDMGEACGYKETSEQDCHQLCDGFTAEGRGDEAEVLSAISTCTQDALCYQRFTTCVAGALGPLEVCYAACDSREDNSCYAESVVSECRAACDAYSDDYFPAWHVDGIRHCISKPLCYRTFDGCIGE